jgi:iron-sulfur cluster repair protein YtfE (RIC family)
MATPILKQEVFEQARAEHEQIRERLKLLHQQLDKRQASLDDIIKRLQELRDCLTAHFRSEECDGFFQQIVEHAPQLTRKADVLSHEHLAMLDELDQLIQFATCDSGQPLCWRTVTLRFDEFMRKLMHHEREENGMLQTAFVDDLGTMD